MADGQVIKKLLIGLGVKIDDKKLAAFNTRLGRARKRMASVAAGARKMAKGLAVIGAAAAGVGFAVFKLADSVSKAGDKFAKASKSIGISAEALQEMSFAAERSGASSDVLIKAFGRMAKAIEDVRLRGTGPLADQLKVLGIGIEEFEGLKPEEAFAKLADIVKGVEDPMKRAAIAQDAFGRAGRELIPMLLEGSEGIKGLREEARKYGIVMSEEATKRSEVFQDRLLEVKGALTGLKNTIGTAVLPLLTRYAEKLRDWIAANGEILAQRMPEFLEKMIRFLTQLGDLIFKAAKAIDLIVIGFVAWKAAVIAATFAMKALEATTAATKIAFGAAAAAASGFAIGLTGAIVIIGQTRAAIEELRQSTRELGQEVDAAVAKTVKMAKFQQLTKRRTQLDVQIAREAKRVEQARAKEGVTEFLFGGGETGAALASLERERAAIDAEIERRSIAGGESEERKKQREGRDRRVREARQRLLRGEKRERVPKPARPGGRRGGRPGAGTPEPTEEERPRSLEELVGMTPRRGEPMRERAPVSITTINNNFDVDAPITIERLPGQDAETVAERVKDGLRDVLIDAAQNLQPARVR